MKLLMSEESRFSPCFAALLDSLYAPIKTFSLHGYSLPLSAFKCKFNSDYSLRAVVYSKLLSVTTVWLDVSGTADWRQVRVQFIG